MCLMYWGDDSVSTSNTLLRIDQIPTLLVPLLVFMLILHQSCYPDFRVYVLPAGRNSHVHGKTRTMNRSVSTHVLELIYLPVAWCSSYWCTAQTIEYILVFAEPSNSYVCALVSILSVDTNIRFLLRYIWNIIFEMRTPTLVPLHFEVCYVIHKTAEIAFEYFHDML